jgi:hypothetical protein
MANRTLIGFALLLVCSGSTFAQSPADPNPITPTPAGLASGTGGTANLPIFPSAEVLLAQKIGDKDKDKKDKKDQPPLPADDLESLRPPRTAFQPIDNKPMFGDQLGTFAQRTIIFKSTLAITLPSVEGLPSQIVTAEVQDQFRVLVPVLSRGSFKVADNASPRPLDRVFVFYTYYDRVPVPVGPSLSHLTIAAIRSQTGAAAPFTLRQNLFDTIQNNPLSPPTALTANAFTFANVHRETIGFEKTFLDGNASIELRLPFVQVHQGISSTLPDQNVQAFAFADLPVTGQIASASSGLGDSFVGDLTLVGKYALLSNPDNGNLLSVGLALTLPTGQAITVSGGPALSQPAPFGGPAVLAFPADQSFRSTLFQPFVGYIVNFDRFYFHGFSAGVIPSDSRDAALLFNDLGIAYRVYENRAGLLRSITPTVEGHITTRLNHNDPEEGAAAFNVVAINAGVHLQLGSRSLLSLGISTPITGPRPYGVEGMVLFNFLY